MKTIIALLIITSVMGANEYYSAKEKAIAGWAYNCGRSIGMSEVVDSIRRVPRRDTGATCNRFLADFSLTREGGSKP